jgi:hypothetical protein
MRRAEHLHVVVPREAECKFSFTVTSLVFVVPLHANAFQITRMADKHREYPYTSLGTGRVTKPACARLRY